MEASKTVNVSRSGAMLRDVPTRLLVGDVIGLKCSNNKKYRFRVAWIGKAGSSDAGNVGLQSLDSGEWIWKDLKLSADDIDIYARPPESERRLINRVRCFLSAEATGNRMGQKALAFIRDISLGGCYVTMTFPFSVEAKVGLAIWLDDQTKIWTDGIVISSHPSTGMGVKFVGMSRPNSLALERCLQELSEAGCGVVRARNGNLIVPV
jgi:PilZ domain